MLLHKYLRFRAPLLLTAVGLFSLAITTLAQSAPPLSVPALPTINTSTIINITNSAWGAVSSTTLTNTTAIQKAINAASATNGGAGATVEFPAGTYLSGPLTMMSHVNLQIDSGATLQMLPYAKWSGTTTFINGSGISDVEISGFGTIDGQGLDWWNAYNSSSIARPYFINFTGSSRILIQDVTLTSPPTFHLMLKGNNTDITIQRITINTDSTSPNTDGMDLGSSNVLVQNCYISDGDDNIEIGGSSALVANLTVTNCQFGTGHGVSIGSLTQGCVSNVTVVHCGFTGTDYGIRMKSDYDHGGIVQNLSYYNIGMTNIKYAPILIYSYYNIGGNPTTYKITPQLAAVTNAYTVSSTTPRWRNIVISNLTATAGQPGMIWGRTELPATNIVLSKLNITASGSYQNFEIYNAKQIQIVDSQFHLGSGARTNFWLYNADVTFSNTAASTSPISLYGVTTNSYVNKLAFYNCPATVSYTNTLGTGPLTLADSTLTVSNNLTLFPTTVLNYTLDPNTNRVAVVGNLALGGTINATSGPGFGAGTNTLLTYTGTLSGSLPTLGSTPGGPYTYSLDSSVAGQVNLVVKSTSTSTPTTTSVQSSVNPSTYGTVVTFTATVSPAPTNGESVTFKDGSTTLGTGTLSSGHATFNTTATQLAAASHSITAVYAGDGAFGGSTSSVLSQTVNVRALTVSGLTVNNKVFDGTTAATLNTNGYTLNTVVGGDAVTLTTNGYIATFVSSNVANGISVTVANLSLGGAQAGNYTLTQSADLTGNITPAGSSILPGSSANLVAHLSAVSFTANVTPSTLNGSVLFLTNGVAFDSQTLSGGVATSATTAVLPRGTNTITAQYSGNSNYSPSTNTLNQIVTNNPPTANPAVYYRLVGYPLTIVITNLSTNWSDLDGDAPVLAGVNASSTNGGTVTFDSANIYYSNSNSVTDQFGYTISDGQGGTNNGIVTVLMAQQTVFNVTVSNGSLTFGFTGIPGSTYWVVAATNLTPPINWTPLSTNVAGTNGLWQFTDIQATNFLQRFYRTQSGR